MNCLFEDNNGAKKYQRLRNLNYILGGCLIFSSAAFIGSNIVKERVPIFGLPPQLSYVPIFLVVTYGLFCNENNIFVSMESITTPAIFGYFFKIIYTDMNKYKRIITMPIYLFSIGLIGLYVLKGYFVIRSRKNFKDFLYDYENRKDHILN